MEQERFIWKKGSTTIEFKEPCITFFNETYGKDFKEKTKDTIMYFYYDVVMKNKQRKKTFSTHDFPKVQNIGAYVDHIVNLDMEKEGLILEDYKHGGFHRKIRYNQITLEDSFSFFMEYFIRFEKYYYEVKQSSENEYKKWVVYKMIMGNPMNPNGDDDCGDCFYFNYLEEADLLSLKDIANKFVDYAVKVQNEYNKNYLENDDNE